jgi:hypothetical protein
MVEPVEGIEPHDKEGLVNQESMHSAVFVRCDLELPGRNVFQLFVQVGKTIRAGSFGPFDLMRPERMDCPAQFTNPPTTDILQSLQEGRVIAVLSMIKGEVWIAVQIQIFEGKSELLTLGFEWFRNPALMRCFSFLNPAPPASADKRSSCPPQRLSRCSERQPEDLRGH